MARRSQEWKEVQKEVEDAMHTMLIRLLDQAKDKEDELLIKVVEYKLKQLG